MIIKFN